MYRRGFPILLMGALCALAAVATEYTWLGTGSDYCWTTEDNWDWDHSVNPHYPGTMSDTAIIPDGGPWSVSLVSEDILWTEIDDSVTFSACQGESSPILTTQVLTMIGPSDQDYITVTVSSGRILATGP